MRASRALACSYAAATVCCLAAANPIRVAVIGDSISTGAQAADRARDGYPARLQALLGDRFQVRAFAESSRCLLRRADLPINRMKSFPEALQWQPDVALIMLGTNDTCEDRPNWQHHDDLEADLRFLLNALREANPRVHIHLLGPPPMFPDKPGLPPARRANLQQRAPHLAVIEGTFRRVAAAEPNVFQHDLTRALRAEHVTDGIHPDTAGHDHLARHLRDLVTTPWEESFDIAERLSQAGLAPKESSFHGYQRFDFTLPGNGAACILVAPRQTAAAHPWIWRARFFGHEPELDLSLLDRGFHLAYCDVANLYGAPEAMARWDAFYELATARLGLGPRPVLEGMSRGGLPIFRWAARHPDRVAAVYGDNPVCDFRSWPGGQHGKRSVADWARLLKAYDLTAAQAAEHPQPREPTVLRPLAAARVPVALVLGLADQVVPPAENGEALARAYIGLGGQVRIWRKPGAGHHPHGLHPPDPLRRYLLKAVSQANPGPSQ